MPISSKYLFLVFIAFCFQYSFGQNEAAIWYFGNNVGLDFTSGNPEVLTDGQLSTFEGCSTIATPDGDLLFYTDGITIWDKNHQIMPNGNGLLGDPSSTQSALIVPKPNDINRYYVFTVDNEAGQSGLRFSEVDMTLNNGDGAVTATKNVLLSTPTTEKISAVQHANGTDFWVVSHSWQSQNFIAYLVSPTGVTTTPVISSVGFFHGNGVVAQTIGYLKISPDASKLALAIYGNGSKVEIFDFDNSTGVVSNPIRLENPVFANSGGGAYGIEFSPDSSILYVSELLYNINSSSVYQFDLSDFNLTSIVASQHTLYQGSDFIGAIQLAVDGKIYLANESTTFLDVINSPNVLGPDANYLNKGLDLNGFTCYLGLPPFIQSFFNASFQVNNTCFGSPTEFILDATDTVDSVLWDFGDGTTSTEESPTHIYLATGTYTVSAIVNSGNTSRSLLETVTIYDVPIANTVTHYMLCDDDSNNGIGTFDLATKTNEVFGAQSQVIFDVAYYLSTQDAMDGINTLPENYENTQNPQQIVAKIYNTQNSNCYDLVTFNLIVNTQPIAHPISDVVLCDGEINDDTETIQLNTFNTVVLLEQDASLFSITYHLNTTDAETGANPLPNSFATQTNPQPVFVRVENTINESCYAITDFTITIDGQLVANQPNNYYLCDAMNDGIENFDFSTLNASIINTQTGNYTITYHLTETDADLNTNPLVLPYVNQSPIETIYARIERENNSFCYDTTSFEIGILDTPEIDLEAIYYLCLDESITITAISGFDSYEWSSGETSESIVLTEAGNYSLTVTNTFATNPITSCSATKNFTVVASNEAIIDTIEIEDWTANNNSITVFASGIGDYEYSIDSVNYQDSNVFTNLGVGEYVVFVRDKNNCGVVADTTYLLYYPKYFTPNGDNYHPYWQIYASQSEPNLTILIYDRYGKFITKLNPLSPGWDGTYNGKNMPASDYWFVVKRPNNEQIYRGHFSLKR
ncbi:T9SS type B sorting domain-containing protein [Lacinutrix salivirga]